MRIYIDDESALGIYVVSTNKPNDIEDKKNLQNSAYKKKMDVKCEHTKLIQSEKKSEHKLNAFFSCVTRSRSKHRTLIFF